MSDELWEDYATLVADVYMRLQAEVQDGLKAVSLIKPIPQEPFQSSSPPRIEPQARSAPPSRPEPPRPEPPRMEPPAPRMEARPKQPVQEPKPEARSAWARYTRDPREELERFCTEEIGDCRRCGRWAGRSRILFGEGPVSAKLVVLTSAPSSEEEKLGKLFVGAAGEMFEKMLANVLNLQRSEIFILPVVMCTSQRAPSSEELTACRSLVVAQLRLLKPRAALAMGPDALAFLGPDVHRGEWTMVEGVEVLPTWHPMELLAQSNNKRAALGHLQDVQRKLAQTSLFGM